MQCPCHGSGMGGRTQGNSKTNRGGCAGARAHSRAGETSRSFSGDGPARGDRLKGSISDNGIPGQDVDVPRLWRRVRLHRRRTTVLLRQALQERTQTVQELQGKACVHSGSGHGAGAGERAGGDTDQLLAVRQRNHGAIPANAGTPGFLPGMLPAAAADGDGVSGSGRAACRRGLASP
jgi:hypothetical protein